VIEAIWQEIRYKGAYVRAYLRDIKLTPMLIYRAALISIMLLSALIPTAHPQTAQAAGQGWSRDLFIRLIGRYAQRHGYVGGAPTFETTNYLDGSGPVWGALLFKPQGTDFRDLRQFGDLEDVSNPDALTRSVGHWASRHGYVGGVPTFESVDYRDGRGPVWGALLFKPQGTDFQDVPANTLRDLDPPIQQTWNTMARGDCEMYNAMLTFHYDGTGWFTSRTTTYSTHSGDVWHIRYEIKDQDGNDLFKLPAPPQNNPFNLDGWHWDGPRMDEHPADIENTLPGDYAFEVPFSYDPAFFNRISKSTAYSSC